MARVLLAIALFLAAAGAPGASPRILLADGVAEEAPGSEKAASPPTTITAPKSLPHQLDQSSLAAQASESTPPGKQENKDLQNTTANSVPQTGAGNKDQQGSTDKSARPDIPENKDQQGGQTNTEPPSQPETKKPPGPDSGDGDKSDKNPKQDEISTKQESSLDKIEDKCDASSLEKCHHLGKLLACLWRNENASNELFLSVHNEGDNNLSIVIKPTSGIIAEVNNLDLPKHNSTEIKILTGDANSGEITVNAGQGDCILHVRPRVSDWQPFQQFAGYAQRLTPIYGAYFIMFTVLIAGGTWACCKLRRGRRVDDGVPYQQLEMSTQRQSGSAVVETADVENGWEDSWGNDWDDEEAASKPPDRQPPSGNVSLNGVLSKSHNNNKDGWDVDWDD